MDYQTVANAKWVASCIEVSRRRENLNWSHHAEVAALEPDDQDRWLDVAIAERLSHKKLRRAITEQKRGKSREKQALEDALTGEYSVFYADPPWSYSNSGLAGAADATDYDYQTVADAKWVAEQIEMVRRRTNLSWSHHKKVAALAPEDQDTWLDLAEDGDEVKLRAERKASGMLAEMAAKGERAGRGGDRKTQSHRTTVKLADLGIKKDESSRWQKIAGVRLEYPEG